jgi:hypothetical protein
MVLVLCARTAPIRGRRSEMLRAERASQRRYGRFRSERESEECKWNSRERGHNAGPCPPCPLARSRFACASWLASPGAAASSGARWGPSPHRASPAHGRPGSPGGPGGRIDSIDPAPSPTWPSRFFRPFISPSWPVRGRGVSRRVGRAIAICPRAWGALGLGTRLGTGTGNGGTRRAGRGRDEIDESLKPPEDA